MRRYVGMVWLLCSVLSAGPIEHFAGGNGYETVYETAIAKALKTKRPVMLVMVTNYCPWCRKFEKRTLRDPDVNRTVQRRFVPLILNREKHAFPVQFDTPRIPIVTIVDPLKEEALRSSMGYLNREEFLAFLEMNTTAK